MTLAARRGPGASLAADADGLRGEYQALRARKVGPAWRGEAPAGNVLAVVSTRTLRAGAQQARGRSSGGGAPGTGSDEPRGRRASSG